MQKSNLTPSDIPALPDNDALLSAFSGSMDKNEIAEVVKELFDEKKIFMISDVTGDEAKLMTRIYMIAKMKNIDSWMTGLAFYSKILLSQKRKSREEILKAISGYSQRMGLLARMRAGVSGMFGGGRGW